jgi:heat shock protein HtpX
VWYIFDITPLFFAREGFFTGLYDGDFDLMMNTQNWVRHAAINRLQTMALLIFLAGYLALLGWMIWGGFGVIWLTFFGALMVLFSPSASPQLVMRLYRARPITRRESPQIYQILNELSRRADLKYLPTPYYVPTNIVNAFAVGTRDKSAIAITDGLVSALDWRELVAVLSHEVSHIRNNDIRVMGLADMASRFSSMLSTIGQILLLLNLPLILFSEQHINWWAVLILLFAPQLSALAQLGLSRVREYDADLNAAMLTGDPEGLARALVKLEKNQNSLWRSVFMPGYRIPEPSLLRTHPPTEERVKRLLELRGNIRPTGLSQPHGSFFDEWDLGRNHQIRKPRWHVSGLWH